jgi:hypothetical protein
MARIVYLGGVLSTSLTALNAHAQDRITQEDLRSFAEYAIRHHLVTVERPELDWHLDPVQYDLNCVDMHLQGFESAHLQ